MRILVHDYSGHPFQVQLSRELARRGHQVLHVHCSSYRTGKGAVEQRDDDPAGFEVSGIELGSLFDRYNPWKRQAQEREYGRRFVELAERWGPDLVISSNDPLLAKWVAARWCNRRKVPWVFWLQDVYSVAMRRTLAQRLPGAGDRIGRLFERIERRLVHRAAAVVTITPDFDETLHRWGVGPDRVTVIENWAPLDELPVRARDNPWSRAQGFADETRNVLYSGTLGLKHNPELLVALARRLGERGDARLVVISEGLGAGVLREAKTAERLDALVLLPFQPYDVFPEVLGSGDVLVCILEPDAGIFSVPSKVLSYHCAGRPILGAIPETNLAARIIEKNDSGAVVSPADAAGFVAAAEKLLDDDRRRERCGRNARRYAEDTFDLDAIADRFETVIARVA